MLADNTLRSVLHKVDVSPRDKLLLILFYSENKPIRNSEIMSLLINTGLQEAAKWNISYLLRSSKGLATSVNGGWILSLTGRDFVQKSGLIPTGKVAKIPIEELRKHLVNIKDQNTLLFLNEAVSCMEYQLYRAAVVFSWVGAVSLLYNHVIQHHLAAFNTEAVRRNSKWKDAKTEDDLARMKESDFLDILDTLSIVGKNVKQELINCLQLRNACGHPNSLQLAETKVAAHLEMLILNVFSVFA